MKRLLKRTLIRGLHKQELWNGNRENPLQIFHPNPEHNVVLWAWKHFNFYEQLYSEAMIDPTWGHLQFHRLRSEQEIEDWFESERDV